MTRAACGGEQRPPHPDLFIVSVEVSSGTAVCQCLQWLDARCTPNGTGDKITEQDMRGHAKHEIRDNRRWRCGTERTSLHEEDDEDDNTRQQPSLARKKTCNNKPRIIDAVELAFPTPKGWKATSHGWESEISSLEDLAIRIQISPYHSSRAPNSAKQHGKCEASRDAAPGWPLGQSWDSLGTPISDSTEEKHWRKHLRRGTYVRNRDPGLADQSCRLNCGHMDESMMHLAACLRAKSFWDRVFTFSRTVLGCPDVDSRQGAILERSS